jgi:hypothetical protein
MNKLFFLSLLLSVLFINQTRSQDIDIFNKHQNDNFKMPSVDKSMSFSEYQLLSRDLRMKHMLYAMIVPGYTHFYAHENELGYSMLATRLTGYAGLAYVLSNNRDSVDLKKLLLLNFNKNDFSSEEQKKYSTITTISLSLIFGSYLFDWIHGQHRLQKKQEDIRFKFSPRLLSGVYFQDNRCELFQKQTVPGFEISLTF